MSERASILGSDSSNRKPVELVAPDGSAIRKRLAKEVIVRDAKGDILYTCVALLYSFKRHDWVWTEPQYTSAKNHAHATFQFRNMLRGVRIRDIHIAPAIGFFVHDNHGDKLSA